MLPPLERLARAHCVLMLQGPTSPYFRVLANWLEHRGVRVLKVNFNAGDDATFPNPYLQFKAPLQGWPAVLYDLIQEENVDAVLVFGECRPIHRLSQPVCEHFGVQWWVMEEGYIRPDFYTLEEGGVNGNSHLPKDAQAYLQSQPPLVRPVAVRPTFVSMAMHSARYWIRLTLGSGRYPHQAPHREISLTQEAIRWATNGLGAVSEKLFKSDEKLSREVAQQLKRQYFFVPLQLAYDSQIQFHSDFQTLERFCAQVIESFARYAPAGCRLVFKRHPFDVDWRRLRSYIFTHARQHGVSDRVLWFTRGDTDALVAGCAGLITVNSTTAMQALQIGRPVKALGRAVYAIEGLVDSQPLKSFWSAPQPPDRKLQEQFRNTLIATTQVNGSLYTNQNGIPAN